MITNSLIALLPADPYISIWSQSRVYKIKTFSVDLDSPANSILGGYPKEERSPSNQFWLPWSLFLQSPRSHGLSLLQDSMAYYFSNLIIPSHCRAFVLARFNLFLLAGLRGRYKDIPYKERDCTCSYNESDSVQHTFYIVPSIHHLTHPLLPSTKTWLKMIFKFYLISSPKSFVPEFLFVYGCWRQEITIFRLYCEFYFVFYLTLGFAELWSFFLPLLVSTCFCSSYSYPRYAVTLINHTLHTCCMLCTCYL